MIPDHLLHQLLTLIRIAYPDWQSFDHPPFLEDEINYKRASAAKAQELLGRLPLDQVPPVLFSEAMRDATLVAEVAGR